MRLQGVSPFPVCCWRLTPLTLLHVHLIPLYPNWLWWRIQLPSMWTCHLFFPITNVQYTFAGLTLLSQGTCSRWQLRWLILRVFHWSRLSVEIPYFVPNFYCWQLIFEGYALQIPLITGALGQSAQYLRNIWCAYVRTELNLSLSSVLLPKKIRLHSVETLLIIPRGC